MSYTGKTVFPLPVVLQDIRSAIEERLMKDILEGFEEKARELVKDAVNKIDVTKAEFIYDVMTMQDVLHIKLHLKGDK